MTKQSSSLDDVALEASEGLYRALTSPRGVALATSDTDRAITLLQRTRAKLHDSDLASLRFAKSPTTEGEVWIIRDDLGSRNASPLP